MKTSVTSFVFGSSNLTFSSVSNPLVRPIAPPTRFSSCPLESSAQCSCSRCTIPAVRTTMFPSSGGQRSFDFSVQELHVALLAVPDENQVSHLLPHVSEYCLLPAILTVFVAFVLVTPSFRIGQILLAAPESTVISTNCVHLDNLYSTFGWIQHTKLLARVRIRRPMCLLQSIARLLLRTLGEPVITSSRILLNPSRRSSQILLNLSRRPSRIFA